VPAAFEKGAVEPTSDPGSQRGLRILFAGKQHFDRGGIPASTDQLAERLSSAGHHVAVFAHAAFDLPPPPPGVDRTAVRPEAAGNYEAYSVDLLPPSVGLDVVARSFQPDVIVINAGGWWYDDWTRPLVQSAPHDIPVVLYVRDHQAINLLPELAPQVDLVLVNAEYHARSAATKGVEAVVVPSLIEPERYRVQPTGEAVVFINPVTSKGVETAFAIAEQRPDVPFQFRESWRLNPAAASAIAARAEALGNVTLLRSTTDPVEPYRCARLLLAPYDDLGRPRVVPEAQVSGIPVLALDAPPLREAVGPGGILVPKGAPVSAWLDALAELWDDRGAHANYADAALRHSRREELDPDRIMSRFLAALSPLRARPGDGRRRPGLTGSPGASVILPVRDVADTLDQQLAALAGQMHSGAWEVIIADNGSSDDTRQRAEAWRPRLPALTIVDASAQRGVGHARNVGARAARGEVLLICDGDDIVADDWLSLMVAALDDHPIVSGRNELRSMNRVEQYDWTGNADRNGGPVAYDFLPYAHGANFGMWREIFTALAGFDEGLLRTQDIDFCWRAAYQGIPVHAEPRAVVHHRMRAGLGAEFRIALRGGIYEPGLYRRHRDHGMPRETRAKVIARYRWLWRNTPGAVRGEINRYRWIHHAGQRLGRVVGSVKHRVVFL
jgi:glycosyltransferase involved in cell wall biosynthesis